MKVLFVANIPTPYRVDFFNELGKKCDLTVAFEGKKATDRNKAWKAGKFTNFEACSLKGIRTGSDRFFCPGILKLLKKDWDFIVLGCYYTPTSMLAIEYLRRKKKKFAIEADGGKIANDSPLKYRVKKHFLSSADFWFSSGKTTTEYFVYYGAKRDRVFEYPFTSLNDEDMYVSAEKLYKDGKTKPGKEDGKFTVLSVGRFMYLKGYDVLLKAASELKDKVDVVMVGGKPLKEYLDYIEEKKLTNITFVDFKSKKELRDYFLNADLFVHPTRKDSWGLVINEALAHGLPVVTTKDCVAGLELIKDGYNGYLFDTDDVKGLETRILRIIDALKESGKMVENALESVNEYTITNMALVHYRVFDSEMKG